MTGTPHWPVVIHYRDDPELFYIADRQQWQEDADLCQWHYDPQDRLIDSRGDCYSLVFDANNGRSDIVAGDRSVSLEEFSGLIQQHLFALAQTCVSKVVLRDYEDGFTTLARLAS